MQALRVSNMAQRWRIALVVFALATLTLGLHAALYHPLYVDDGFISLRYAERLLDGHGLTWNDGERVEGYSNLLWVLLCAGLGGVGFDLVTAGRIVGGLSGLAAVAAPIAAHRPRRWSQALPAAIGALALALCAPLVIWAVGGLEATLLSALLLWAVVLSRRLLLVQQVSPKQALCPGVLLALVCLTRPDGPLLAAVGVVALADGARARRGLSGALKLAAGLGVLPLVATLGQLLFRLSYYGDFVPNTARAKVAFTEARLVEGASCVSSAALSALPLCIMAATALLVSRGRRRGPVLFSAAFVVVWVAYGVVVACYFFGYRTLVPALAMLALLAADGAAALRRVGRPRRGLRCAMAALLLGAFGGLQALDDNITAAAGRVKYVSWKASAIGRLLGEQFGDERPLVAVNAAGAVPYFSKLPALDMLGLNDRYLAMHPPATLGQGMLGHELGDGAYVMRRAPDLIIGGVLGETPGLPYRAGAQLMKDAAFVAAYRRLRFNTTEPERRGFYIWCRLDGRVGASRSPARVQLPGYLLASGKGAVAMRSDRGWGTVIAAGKIARLERLSLPAGSWQAKLDAEGHADVAIGWPDGRDGDRFQLDSATEVDVVVHADDAVLLRSLVIERQGS